MYKCVENVADRNGSESPAGYSTSTSSGVLSLPKISASVPVYYKEGIEEPVIKLARFLSRENIISAEDRNKDETITTTISRVLQREIERQTGEMKKFHLDFQFSTAKSSPYWASGDIDANNTLVFTISHSGHVPYVNVSESIRKLNKVHPELAQTLYAVLEMASIRSMGILTFSNCCGRFSYELQIVDDEDEKEEYEAEEIPFLSKADVDQLAESFSIPWINSAKPVLTPYEVWTIAERKRCPKWIKQCIEAALEVAQAYEKEGAERGLGTSIDHNTIFSLGAIELYEQDPTQQLMDDVCNVANECSDNYTTNLHEEYIPLTSEKEFLSRWREISNGLKLLGKLDKLFHALAQHR